MLLTNRDVICGLVSECLEASSRSSKLLVDMCELLLQHIPQNIVEVTCNIGSLNLEGLRSIVIKLISHLEL
jgi:hypothetical protein